MKKTKGFSYDTEKDMDVINHIEKQPHQANYILELVRSDMFKLKDTDIEKMVKKYVREYCESLNLSSKEVEENKIGIGNVMDLLNLGK